MNDFKDREHSINISILELKEKNMELIKNSKDPIMLTPESFNNAVTLEKYLILNKDYTTVSNSINRINAQLEPQKLADTTYNHLSNGEYAKLSNEITFMYRALASMNLELDTLTKEAEKNKVNEKIEKLRRECKPFEVELEKLKDTHKGNFESTKNAIETKLINKLINLEEKKSILKDSLASTKSNFEKGSSLNILFKEKKDAINKKNGIYDYKSRRYLGRKASLNDKFTNEKILSFAKNMMTKGEYYLAINGYRLHKKELDKVESKLKNTSFTNIIERTKLKKEQAILSEKVNGYKNEYDKMNELFIKKPKDLMVYVDKIKDVKIETLKAFNTQYVSAKQIEFEANTELSAIKSLEKTLVNTRSLQEKYHISIYNPFEAYVENTNTRGGSTSILDQEDEILKKKKKSKGLSL